MSATLVSDPPSPRPAAIATPARPAQADAFPHTRRPLPWFLAAFVAMVYLVPIDATELKVKLGVDAHPDRLGVIVLVLAWMWFGGDQRAFLNTRRSKLWVTAALIFLVVAAVSFFLDSARIINLGELQLSEKKFAVLLSFLTVGWFALTALRFEDLRGFSGYLVGLASVMAVGMLIERRTGYNPFYEISAQVLSPIATVAKAPTDIIATEATEGRITVVGPAMHGLAATTMLVMAMPFALVKVFDTRSRRTWWLNLSAVLLLFAAAIATDRKTALLVPLALIIYVGVYRRRQLLKLAPLGLVLLLAAHAASPGSLGTILDVNQLSSNSTTHRANDLASLMPDILAHPAFGRGYGALNSEIRSIFRINDNQYLDEVWETGLVGLVAFVWMILAPIVLARPAIRNRGPTVSSLALAASGGCVAFLVVCALFDSMGFTEAPYMFFVIAAFTTVAAAGPEGNVIPAHEEARLRARARAAERSSPPAARPTPVRAPQHA